MKAWNPTNVMLFGALIVALGAWWGGQRDKKFKDEIITKNNQIISLNQELTLLQKRSQDGVLQTTVLDPKKEVFIKLGSNGLKTNFANLTAGYSLRPGSFYKVEGRDPISIKLENDKLVIDAWINDERGAMIANIVSNKWKVPPSNNYDINFDPSAFEIYDVEKQLPIVQIQVKDNNTISVSGIFNYRNGTRVVISPGDLVSDNPPETQLSEMQDQLRAGRLFMYPSQNNIGVRNPNYTEIRTTKSRP